MPLRVLHCPTNTGGHSRALANAERKIGLESRQVSFESHPYGYEADEVLYAGCTSELARKCRRWGLLWRALRNFDIVHFNFGQSILPPPRNRNWSLTVGITDAYHRLGGMADLPILKWAGKGIVVTYQGDDARQGQYCQEHFSISPAGEVEEGYYSAATDAHKRQLIGRMAKYADRIYALNPDLLHVLPPQARFLPYGHVDLCEWRPSTRSRVADKTPLVVHAPSHRGVKGTRFVLEAVQRLQKEGVQFEFELVENVPRTVARHAYERADLVVDQLLCGWYGGFAVECMALGKPVIAYIRDGDLGFIPDKMRAELPLIQATPQTIYEVLKEWLTERRDELPEMGEQSRTFVERWHDPLKIAANLKNDYEDIARRH